MVGPKERRGEKGRVLPTNKGGETAKPGKEWGDHPTKKTKRRTKKGVGDHPTREGGGQGRGHTSTTKKKGRGEGGGRTQPRRGGGTPPNQEGARGEPQPTRAKATIQIQRHRKNFLTCVLPLLSSDTYSDKVNDISTNGNSFANQPMRKICFCVKFERLLQ